MPTDDPQRSSLSLGAAAVVPAPAVEQARRPVRHFGHLGEERLAELFVQPPRPLRELTAPHQHAAAMGAVLYTPASRTGVADRFVGGGWRGLTAMAFCLEDAIADADLGAAEEQTRLLLERVADATDRAGSRAHQPYLLVRVRTPDHLERLLAEWGPLADGIDGILLAKIGAERMAEYLPIVRSAQTGRDRPLW
ncbi:MAG: HpcH/HpaI aldolase/citrate lyase family protein, partial [Patulibacter minatonensis]